MSRTGRPQSAFRRLSSGAAVPQRTRRAQRRAKKKVDRRSTGWRESVELDYGTFGGRSSGGSPACEAGQEATPTAADVDTGLGGPVQPLEDADGPLGREAAARHRSPSGQ